MKTTLFRTRDIEAYALSSPAPSIDLIACDVGVNLAPSVASVTGRRLLAGAILGTAAGVLVTIGAVSAMRSNIPATLAGRLQQPVTMPIQELQRQIDVKSLPTLEIKDLV